VKCYLVLSGQFQLFNHWWISHLFEKWQRACILCNYEYYKARDTG